MSDRNQALTLGKDGLNKASCSDQASRNHIHCLVQQTSVLQAIVGERSNAEQPFDLSTFVNESDNSSSDSKQEKMASCKVMPSRPLKPCSKTVSTTPDQPLTTISTSTSEDSQLLTYPIDVSRYLNVPLQEWAMAEVGFVHNQSTIGDKDGPPARTTEYASLSGQPATSTAYIKLEQILRHGSEDRKHSLAYDSDLNHRVNESRADDVKHIALRPGQGASVKRDSVLLSLRRGGYSYREIKEIAHFDEPESTLRGRVRALTKRPKDRVRKPQWREKDVHLLRQAVSHFTKEDQEDQLSSGSRLPWKKISMWMSKHGASYDFAPATCSKKWSES